MSRSTSCVPRVRGLILLVVASSLAMACGAAASDEQEQARITAFCVMNPKRDFGALFTIADEAGAQAPAASGLASFGASAFRDPPAQIRPDVELVLDALLASRGQRSGAGTPEVRAAIERINEWMASTCPPSAVATAPTTVAGETPTGTEDPPGARQGPGGTSASGPDPSTTSTGAVVAPSPIR